MHVVYARNLHSINNYTCTVQYLDDLRGGFRLPTLVRSDGFRWLRTERCKDGWWGLRRGLYLGLG